MVVYVSCLSLCLIILLIIFPTCLLSALDTRSKKISQPEKELYAFRFELSSLGKRPGIYYQSLIERFSRDIYEILITSQYNTERLRKFYESIDNFFSMAIFYQKTDTVQDLSYTKIAPQDSPFCMTLLFHHYLNITETIRLLSEDILRITELNELSEELEQFIEQAFSSTWGNSQEIIDIGPRSSFFAPFFLHFLQLNCF